MLFAARNVPWTPIPRAATANSLTLRRALEDCGAQSLINAAGFTGKPNVDACEIHKLDCLAGNALLPGIVRSACELLDLPWGHVSSGCIFTGRFPTGRGFQENDAPNFSFRQNNCSFYSGCKALGEELLVGADRCYVWRLRIPFESSANPRNYLQKLQTYARLLEAENSLSHLGEFVAACHDCLLRHLPYGVYNLTNPGSIWTSEVTELLRRSGVADRDFHFFSSESEFMQLAASTPRSNCVLDSSKAIQAGLHLSPVADAIAACLSRWNDPTTRSHCEP